MAPSAPLRISFRKFPLLLLLIFLLSAPAALGQRFWLTTYEFWGGPKLSLASTPKDCLLVGVGGGVMQSCNEGFNWTLTRTSGPIFALHVARSGAFLAGSRGKIFFSQNEGARWDSVALPAEYPVRQFAENVAGDLFAITGEMTVEEGFVGAGVFFSADGGRTWSQRNHGLGAFLSADKITIDRNGRLYLAVADEEQTNQGGLFISDDNGLTWQHVNLTINGRGVIENNLSIFTTTSLSISPQDSVLLSFSGVAGSTGRTLVTLNLSKSISDIGRDTPWTVRKVGNSVSWWLDRQLQDIHYARNGDWYSSFPGSINVGGTLYSRNQGRSWEVRQEGLGLDMFGRRNRQSFAEVSSGKMYMIHHLAELIHWADASLLTGIKKPGQQPGDLLTLFPNPTNHLLHLQPRDGQAATQVTLRTLTGQIVRTFTPPASSSPLTLDLTDLPPATYLLQVHFREGFVVKKVVKI